MTRSRRRLTIILPLVSLLVSAGIVMHQYARRDRLRRDLKRYEREYYTLDARFTKSGAPTTIHHDD